MTRVGRQMRRSMKVGDAARRPRGQER
jgi:hypothetical protein